MRKSLSEESYPLSIGDHDEDEAASLAAGVPFVRVTEDTCAEVWAEVARLIATGSAS
jgi:hypothetical protein